MQDLKTSDGTGVRPRQPAIPARPYIVLTLGNPHVNRRSRFNYNIRSPSLVKFLFSFVRASAFQMTTDNHHQIPCIDLSLPEHECALQIRQVCREHGFMTIRNHGVPESLVAQLFEQNRRFFQLPLAIKNRILLNAKNRGYTPMFEQNLDPTASKYGDYSEGLYFGRDIDHGDSQCNLPLHGQNQWPDAALLPDYKSVTQKYFREMEALGLRMVRLIAVALGLRRDHFDADFQQPLFALRPLHYPGKKSNMEGEQPLNDDDTLGAGAHTDYGLITLLATDNVPGLQIKPPGQSEWIRVKPVPGCFIVNLGDMFYRWTGGRFQSTLHRVLIPQQDRYSVAFFMEPNYHAVVRPIQELRALWPVWKEDPDADRWEPLTCGEYLLQRYAETRKSVLERDGK